MAYGPKMVTVTYYIDGRLLEKKVLASNIRSTIEFLRKAGASGIKVRKGKTKKKEVS